MTVGRAWQRDDERNMQLYSELVAKYGTDVRALNWGSKGSQQVRFAVLAQVGRLDGMSVLDVGCGLGDLYGWLDEAGIKVSYTGIDITPRMVDIARQRFVGARFEVRNLLEMDDSQAEQYDYVLASGLFTHRHEDPFGFLSAMTRKIFSLCRYGAAINSLSSWASQQEGDEFHADPLETTKFCRTLTPWVVMRHDYHPGDFTVYLYKRSNG